jgi:hypothetical protein
MIDVENRDYIDEDDYLKFNEIFVKSFSICDPNDSFEI